MATSPPTGQPSVQPIPFGVRVQKFWNRVKVGSPLQRDSIRESIRALYATGRFADIQAEVAPSGEGIALTLVTSPNFFVGAVKAEGAPTHPTANQILNASKLQLGELYTHDKLNRALENIRQLMQENGYYRARVTAESAAIAATQQIDVLFHVSAGSQAQVGELKVTGTSNLSSSDVQGIQLLARGSRNHGHTERPGIADSSCRRRWRRLRFRQPAVSQAMLREGLPSLPRTKFPAPRRQLSTTLSGSSLPSSSVWQAPVAIDGAPSREVQNHSGPPPSLRYAMAGASLR